MNPAPQFLARTGAAAILSCLLLAPLAHAQAAAGAAPAKAPAATPAKADAAVKLPSLTVAQIVDKNVAARGGASAWKVIHGLQFSGKLEAGKGSMDPVAAKTAAAGKRLPGKEGDVVPSVPDAAKALPETLLPFVMDFERPNKSRVEVEFQGKTAIQVFDGSKGWKYRPFLNRKDVEPFTNEEMASESARAEPEGYLVNAASKGSTVVLEGTDKVDGQGAYKLKVTEKGGRVVHVWVDASSFLDVKVSGAPRHMDGKMHDTYVTQRDFRKIEGVLIPFVLETVIDGYPDSGKKLMIEKAVVNPAFAADTFAKPKV